MRRGPISLGLVLFAAAATPACNESDSVVIVKVGADVGIAEVFQLRALVSNAGQGATRVFPGTPGAQPIAFDTSFSLTVPRDRTGALDIALEGLDAGGTVVANGAGSVDLHVGDNVTVTITLHDGAALCGNGVIDAGEACDDGDRLSSGDCDYLCQRRTSGPGVGGSGGGAAGAGGSAAGTGGSGGRGGAGGGGGTGGGRCTIDLLTSGNFDGDNSSWTQVTSGRMLIYGQNAPSFVPLAQTPPSIAWLGYNVVSMKPAIRQSIQVPANAVQVNISGYYRIDTDESGCACDFARVQLIVGNGEPMNLLEWSALNANDDWAFFSTFVNAAPIAGQTVTLQIQADMDDATITNFYFDSLSVTANLCP